MTPVCPLVLYPLSQLFLRDLGCVCCFGVQLPSLPCLPRMHNLQFPLLLTFGQNIFYLLQQSVLVSMPCFPGCFSTWPERIKCNCLLFCSPTTTTNIFLFSLGSKRLCVSTEFLRLIQPNPLFTHACLTVSSC